MKTLQYSKTRQTERRGAILVFAGALLVVVIGVAAFTVAFGMVTLTKAQMQNASDSAAHAAVMEISRGFGPGGELSETEAESVARAAAASRRCVRQSEGVVGCERSPRVR